MGSVPVWVLVLNTIITAIATGGLTVVSLFIVPKREQVARAEDERRANAAIMRDKAEEIFAELSKIEAGMAQQLVAAGEALIRGNNDDATPMPNFNNVSAMAAVYYPNLLPIVDAIEAPFVERVDRLRQAFAAATVPKTMKGATAELKSLRLEMVLAQWENSIAITKKARARLIEDVRPYLPSLPAVDPAKGSNAVKADPRAGAHPAPSHPEAPVAHSEPASLAAKADPRILPGGPGQ